MSIASVDARRRRHRRRRRRRRATLFISRLSVRSRAPRTPSKSASRRFFFISFSLSFSFCSSFFSSLFVSHTTLTVKSNPFSTKHPAGFVSAIKKEGKRIVSATTVVINNRRLAATKFQGKLLPSTQPILRTLRIRTIHWQGGKVCRGVGDWKSGGSAPKMEEASRKKVTVR